MINEIKKGNVTHDINDKRISTTSSSDNGKLLQVDNQGQLIFSDIISDNVISKNAIALGQVTDTDNLILTFSKEDGSYREQVEFKQIRVSRININGNYIEWKSTHRESDILEYFCRTCDYVISQLGLPLPTPTTRSNLNSNVTTIVNFVASQDKTLAAQGILGFVIYGHDYFGHQYIKNNESEFYTILLQGTYDQMAIIKTNTITYLSGELANILETSGNTIEINP